MPPRPLTFAARLDRLPTWAAVATGVGLGGAPMLAAAWAAARLGGWWAGAGVTVVGLCAAWAAWRLAQTGTVVAIERVFPSPAPGPAPMPAPPTPEHEVIPAEPPPPPPVPDSPSAVPEVIPPAPGPPPRAPELISMVDIPAGEFLMGGDMYDNEQPKHLVRVSAFSMGVTPVTQAQFAAVMGRNPGAPQGDDLPVNNVSWFDAVDFCIALSATEGRTPCYRRDGESVELVRGADGYRLPTEAEWEYAARAGTTAEYFFGNEIERISDFGWFRGNSNDTRHPVGRRKANPFGLHDVCGNIWEWCWDWQAGYGGASVDDPQGPSTGDRRVLRGGSFFDGPERLRSAFRLGNSPEGRSRYGGFRCVRAVRRQP